MSFEIAISNWFHSFSTPWLDFIFKSITTVGSGSFLTIVIVIVSIFLLFRFELHKSHIVVLSGIMSGLGSFFLKRAFDRPRSDLWIPLVEEHSLSFPSGHAMISVAVYGALAMFLAEKYPNRKMRIYSLFGILIFLIGISRIYLGVHWTTDILGGWVFGGLVLSLMVWWYHKGGIGRLFRIGIGLITIILGLIGMIFPLIPGIPMLILGFLLVFSSKSITGMFRKKRPLNQYNLL